MLSIVQGRIAHIEPGLVTVVIGTEETGIGLDVTVPKLSSLLTYSQGDLIFLTTKLVLKEESIILYGFITKQQRELFESLIKIRGIGSKIAMNILAEFTPEEFYEEVKQENSTRILDIEGIGIKMLEKIKRALV